MTRARVVQQGMVSVSRAATIEAVQTDIQAGWIVL